MKALMPPIIRPIPAGYSTMKQTKKLKKPKLKRIKRPFKRAVPTEEKVSEALSSVPRITNETVAEHREEVLSTARKYIYPLQHSKHHVGRISVSILAPFF